MQTIALNAFPFWQTRCWNLHQIKKFQMISFFKNHATKWMSPICLILSWGNATLSYTINFFAPQILVTAYIFSVKSWIKINVRTTPPTILLGAPIRSYGLKWHLQNKLLNSTEQFLNAFFLGWEREIKK